MKKYFYIISITFFIFYSCNGGKENPISVKNISRIKVDILKDTVFINENAKAIAQLENPYFKNENSKIIVIIEIDENYPLKKDLSNEYDIPVEGFHNLSFDTINQKWFKVKESNYNKSTVFGRKFSTVGNHKIRGYVLEYISKHPPLDMVIDNKNYRKYFFEKEVFVKDTLIKSRHP